MSHYDCKNCGHYLGINFGQCEACTPQEFFDLQKELRTLSKLSELAWDNESDEARKIFIKEYLEDKGYSHMVNRLDGLRKTHLNLK
jgi:predicted ATP-dependent serine protease